MNLQNKIKVACSESDITLTELADKLGVSQAALSKRVKTGKFTQEELEEIAEKIGCKYRSFFELPNGTIIE